MVRSWAADWFWIFKNLCYRTFKLLLSQPRFTTCKTFLELFVNELLLLKPPSPSPPKSTRSGTGLNNNASNRLVQVCRIISCCFPCVTWVGLWWECDPVGIVKSQDITLGHCKQIICCRLHQTLKVESNPGGRTSAVCEWGIQQVEMWQFSDAQAWIPQQPERAAVLSRVQYSVCDLLVRAAYQHCVCMQEMKSRSATLETCQIDHSCGRERWKQLGILHAPAHDVQLKKRCIGKLGAWLALLGVTQTRIIVTILTSAHTHTGNQQACIYYVTLMPVCYVCS